MRLVDVETMELYTAIHLTAEDARELKDSLQKMFDKAPTIDAVPVVQCKDCKYLIDRDDGTHGCYRNFMDNCKIDDFCSRGENE